MSLGRINANVQRFAEGGIQVQISEKEGMLMEKVCRHSRMRVSTKIVRCRSLYKEIGGPR